MPLEARRPAQRGPSPKDQAATKQLDGPILPTVPVYVVIMLSRYGTGLRRPFLSLHAATKAMERARERGCPAELVLCRLEPVTAVDLVGGDPS